MSGYLFRFFEPGGHGIPEEVANSLFSSMQAYFFSIQDQSKGDVTRRQFISNSRSESYTRGLLILNDISLHARTNEAHQ